MPAIDNGLDRITRRLPPGLPASDAVWNAWLRKKAAEHQAVQDRRDAIAEKVSREYRREEYQRQHGV